MSMSRWSVASAIVAVAAPVVAAPVGNFSVERLSKVDKTLASDAFQGRGTASAIEPTVINYIAGELKAAGVQPGGDLIDGKRSWFQEVPLLESEIVGAPDISLDENGAKVPLQQGPQIAVLPPLNGAKQVDIHEAPLVFVGYGVDAPERGWNDFKSEDMHGKILVELVNDPDFEAAPGEPVAGKFGGKAMTYYGRWTYKFEEAARHGAAGVILIHETVPASYPWQVVETSNTVPQFDIVRDNPAAQHTQFESWIQRQLAAELFQRSGIDLDKAKAAARQPDFKPIALKATLSARYSANPQIITSHNVVGILPGKSHPDETIIYSAHWDHLGVGKPDATGDRIYNGAVDNATGVSMIIEQARAFASERASRPLSRLPCRHGRGKGSSGKQLLRHSSALPGRQDGRRAQHRCIERVGAGEELQYLRNRKARPTRRSHRRSQARSPQLHARSAPRKRRLLPLRSFLLRQAGRSCDQLRGGQ